MKRNLVVSIAMVILLAAVLLTSAGCLGGTTTTGGTPTPLKPKPTVLPVVATTSGTETAYYAILDIKVKNEGAEGTILVVASVTQAGKTNQNEMAVYLKQNQTHELKLTFPLVWKGGEFTTNVQAIIP